MVHMSDDEFEELVEQALDDMPEQFVQDMENVAVVIADEPTDEELRRVAAAFCVPYGDLMRGWVPLYANRDLPFDKIHHRSDRSPSPEER